MESTIGCKVEDVIDLSADIVWTQIEMDNEEESNGEDEEVKMLRILQELCHSVRR